MAQASNTLSTIRELEAQALTAALLHRVFNGRRGGAAAPAISDPTKRSPAPAAAVVRELECA